MRASPVGTVSFFFAASLAFLVGCGGKEPPAADPGKGAASEVDYVNKSFMGKMIGDKAARYKPESAKEAGAGKVRIEDTTGVKYEVTVTKQGSEFKASDPTPVK